MKKYTLTIDRDTFIWICSDFGLAYNSRNFKSYKFKITKRIIEVCMHLNEIDNLYTIVLDDDELNINEIKDFVDNLLLIESAYFKVYDNNYPISIKPTLKVQNDVKKIVDNCNYSEMINTIRNINIHLAGAHLKDNERLYAYQYEYPSDRDEYIDYNKLLRFIDNLPSTKEINLNIIHGDTNYPQLENLCKLLVNKKDCVLFHFRLNDICRLWNEISPIIKDFKISITCEIGPGLLECISFIQKNIPNPQFVLLISSDIDVEQLHDRFNDFDCKILPIFNGSNKLFFEKYVYLDKYECQQFKKDKRSIFLNEALNSNFFGTLNILQDGLINDNMNFPPIGTLDDEFPSIIFNLFDYERAWFYTRHRKPCNDCIYKLLCPPPSNYELVLQRHNLCNM